MVRRWGRRVCFSLNFPPSLKRLVYYDDATTASRDPKGSRGI